MYKIKLAAYYLFLLTSVIVIVLCLTNVIVENKWVYYTLSGAVLAGLIIYSALGYWALRQIGKDLNRYSASRMALNSKQIPI
jgi:hypothetical protein